MRAAARAPLPRALLPFRALAALARPLSSAAAPAGGGGGAGAGALGAVPGTGTAGAPAYVMVFTCAKCETRTARRVSKAAFHEGTVLVRCPGCLNLHVVADRLGFFSDEALGAEALARVGGADGLELTADDARALAAAGRSVRLRAAPGGGGEAGDEPPVVTFDGVLPEKKRREG